MKHIDVSDAVAVAPRVIEVIVTVTGDGADVTPPGLNPVRIVNPPVLVPDPRGKVVVGGVAHRRDPRAAIEAVIASLVD